MRLAEGIGLACQLQRADQIVVETALHDDARVSRAVAGCAAVWCSGSLKQLVDILVENELARRRHAHIKLEFLLPKRDRRVREALVVKPGRAGQRRARRHHWLAVRLGGKFALHMTGANPQLHHDRRVRGFRQRKRLLDAMHNRFQIWARIDQPHRRLHRIGMGAFLNHRRALAIVFAHHDQRAASDAG